MGGWLEEVQSRIGYRFSRPELLSEALTHASASGETPSNERLEFLGDAVLDLVISAHLVATMPEASEGELTVARSAVVSRRALARVGKRLGLGNYLVVDAGLRQRGQYPPSMFADAYEAVVGAVFLDGSLGHARIGTRCRQGAPPRARL